MARPKQFDPEVALDAAIAVFREHGYAAASADMLSDAMQIGKQSIYNTFGGKWQLYCTAVERYSAAETSAHVEALKAGETALNGIQAMMARVAAEASLPCLGVGSVSEFGMDREESKDLSDIRSATARRLKTVLVKALQQAKADTEVAKDLDERQAADFLVANIAALRIAARGGAGKAELQSLSRLVLRALQ